jgi:hypothetical protein
VLRDSVGLFTGLGIAAVMTVLLGAGIQVYAVVRRRQGAS